MKKSSRFAGAALVAAAILAAPAAVTQARAPQADTITSLAGRWAGVGSYTPARGPSKPFKCVVTYFPDRDGGNLKQNLRCQSDAYRLDAATRLVINGNQVTGKWEDRIHALTGDVYGLVTKDGFNIQLQGQFFQANMIVVSSACEQSVTVTPLRADYVREVQASLKKC